MQQPGCTHSSVSLAAALVVGSRPTCTAALCNRAAAWACADCLPSVVMNPVATCSSPLLYWPVCDTGSHQIWTHTCILRHCGVTACAICMYAWHAACIQALFHIAPLVAAVVPVQDCTEDALAGLHTRFTWLDLSKPRCNSKLQLGRTKYIVCSA